MRPMHRALALLALLALVTTALGAQGKRPARAAAPRPKPDVVTLTFGWPAGTRATVAARRVRINGRDGARDTTDVAFEFRMSVDAADSGLVIRHHDFIAAGDAASDATTRAAFARLGNSVPSYRVTPAGAFVRLEEMEALRAAIDSAVAPLRAGEDTLSPQLRELMRASVSDQMLAASAAQEWNALVAAWAGATLEVGETYVNSSEESTPLFRGVQIKVNYLFSAVRRLPCDSAASPRARDCVELRMVSRPDSASVQQILQRVLGATAPTDGAVTGLHVESEVVLISRPESLLPVRVVMSKEISTTVRQDGKDGSSYQLDWRELRFAYE